jgi:thiamine-phosphate pyrophosphorylase
MFIVKKKYFLIIESIKDIDLSNIKILNKFAIIYRNKNKIVNINKLLKFRSVCRRKKIDFYVSNDINLSSTLKADGLYISAYNKNLHTVRLKKANFKIIGSAHNIRELNIKSLQGCSDIIFSRLFETSYKYKIGFLGVIKFNLLKMYTKKNLVPLGGIKISNLNKINMVKCRSIACLSEVKKKPAIINRLF